MSALKLLWGRALERKSREASLSTKLVTWPARFAQSMAPVLRKLLSWLIVDLASWNEMSPPEEISSSSAACARTYSSRLRAKSSALSKGVGASPCRRRACLAGSRQWEIALSLTDSLIF